MKFIKPKILCVDDDDAILRFLKNMFEKKYTVFTAYDGVEALCFFSKNMIPDLIITDSNMENISGYELVKHLSTSSIYNDIPVIVLSGNPNDDIKAIKQIPAVFDVLNKPFDPLLLSHIAEDALAKTTAL